MHACYLHGDSFTLAHGTKTDKMQIDKREMGSLHRARRQQDVNFDWVEMVHRRPPGPLPPRHSLSGGGRSGRAVPHHRLHDAVSTTERPRLDCSWRFRQVSGVARESWRFLYRATLEGRHWDVLEQDREMLINIPADAHKREMLYQHDVGVARMRRTLMQQAKSQIDAEAAAAMQRAV